jgi:hypothetical protein
MNHGIFFYNSDFGRYASKLMMPSFSFKFKTGRKCNSPLRRERIKSLAVVDA